MQPNASALIVLSTAEAISHPAGEQGESEAFPVSGGAREKAEAHR